MTLKDALNINKNIIVSLSKFPGNFGNKVHNTMMNFYNLDYRYIACECKNLEQDIELIRKNNVRGCGISMPYKQEVIKYIDKLHYTSSKVGAVNTIVNENGVLIGYNTDIYGAEWASNFTVGNIALLGNGGMSKAFQYALRNKRYKIITRDNWNILKTETFTTIINATSIGMNSDDSPVSDYKHYVGIDSVVRMTPFVKNSCIGINGIDISLIQAGKQFKLYFGLDVEDNIMRNSIKDMYENN